MSKNKIDIAIVVGSDSDLPKVKDAFLFLDELQIPYYLTIASAHRTPKLLHTFVETSVAQGAKVFIAAAGGAAHLPGVLSSMTALPVIGIPIKTDSLSGVDSLYSIVQMPAGMPVATVGINAGKNAAILACQILGTHDAKVLEKVKQFRQYEADKVKQKAEELNEIGYLNYITL
jgi:5-(carboxyamino)imidazole ribonucleotide mutase